MPSALPVGVKRQGQTLAVTSAPGLVPSRLFHIMDRTSGRGFLVDTGAKMSVFPPSSTEHKCPSTSLPLHAANSSPIATYGTRSFSLDLNLQRSSLDFCPRGRGATHPRG